MQGAAAAGHEDWHRMERETCAARVEGWGWGGRGERWRAQQAHQRGAATLPCLAQAAEGGLQQASCEQRGVPSERALTAGPRHPT